MRKLGIILSSVLLIFWVGGCQAPVDMPTPTKPTDISTVEYQEITNGAFLGGGMLYHPTNPKLNHFSNVNKIPVRFAKVTASETFGSFNEQTIIEGVPGGITQSTTPGIEYKDVPELVWMGWMSNLVVSATGVTFDLDLYDANLDLKVRKRGAQLPLNGTYDCNGDGLDDMEFKAFDAKTRTGFDGTYILNFISHEPVLGGASGSTSMHKIQDDANFTYPSNILTVNPSGNLVIRLKTDQVTVTGEQYQTTAEIPDLLDGDFLNLISPTLVAGGNNDDFIREIKTDSLASGTVTMSTLTAPASRSYGVMSLSLKGSVSDLEARFARGQAFGTSRGVTIPILDNSGIFNDASGNIKFEYLFKLFLYMDFNASIGWDHVSANAEFTINTEAKAILDAAFNAKITGDFESPTLFTPAFGFIVGGVPVDIEAPVAVGAEYSLEAAGKFRVGGGFKGRLGLKASAGAWVHWDWWNTSIRTGANLVGINEFTAWKIDPVLEITGKAIVRPYVQVSPRLVVAKILKADVKLRGYLDAQATLKASTETGIKVDWALRAGVRGFDPGVELGVNVFGYNIGFSHRCQNTNLFNVISDPLVQGEFTFPLPASPQVLTPSFSPAAGSYADDQSVSIISATPGTTIRYTTDGSEPTITSAVYSSPINVDRQTTLKAKAWKSGYADSYTGVADYTITNPWPAPSINPSSGTWFEDEAQTVTMTSTITGATIRYTTDGSEPMSTSTPYTTSFSVNSTKTFKARTFLTGRPGSSTTTATLNFSARPGTAEKPVFGLPGSGRLFVVGEQVEVPLTSASPGVTIRYTLDGNDPTETSGTVYTGPISIPNSLGAVMVKAIAYGGGLLKSSVAVDSYTFINSLGTVADALLSTPGNATTTSAFNPKPVTITCATTDALIRYTLDGSNPSLTNGITYSGPITLSASATVKARAFKGGYTPSVNITSKAMTFLTSRGLKSVRIAGNTTSSGGGSGLRWVVYNPGTGWGNDSCGAELGYITNALHNVIDANINFSTVDSGKFVLGFSGGCAPVSRTLYFYDADGALITSLTLTFGAPAGLYGYVNSGYPGNTVTANSYIFTFDGTNVTYELSQ